MILVTSEGKGKIRCAISFSWHETKLGKVKIYLLIQFSAKTQKWKIIAVTDAACQASERCIKFLIQFTWNWLSETHVVVSKDWMDKGTPWSNKYGWPP